MRRAELRAEARFETRPQTRSESRLESRFEQSQKIRFGRRLRRTLGWRWRRRGLQKLILKFSIFCISLLVREFYNFDLKIQYSRMPKSLRFHHHFCMLQIKIFFDFYLKKCMTQIRTYFRILNTFECHLFNPACISRLILSKTYKSITIYEIIQLWFIVLKESCDQIKQI